MSIWTGQTFPQQYPSYPWTEYTSSCCAQASRTVNAVEALGHRDTVVPWRASQRSSCSCHPPQKISNHFVPPRYYSDSTSFPTLFMCIPSTLPAMQDCFATEKRWTQYLSALTCPYHPPCETIRSLDRRGSKSFTDKQERPRRPRRQRDVQRAVMRWYVV